MTFKISLGDKEHDIRIVRRRPHLVVSVDGREHEINDTGTSDEGYQEIVIAGHEMTFARAFCDDRMLVRMDGRTFATTMVDPRAHAEGGGDRHDVVRAPMPGAVVQLHRHTGDEVKRGETIVTIESMKLQTALTAPRDGRIADLVRQEGQTFEKDEVLVRLEPMAESK